MTLFTDNPLERMMIQKPGDGGRGGVQNRRPLPFPRAARAVPTTGSRPAWGIVSRS